MASARSGRTPSPTLAPRWASLGPGDVLAVPAVPAEDLPGLLDAAAAAGAAIFPFDPRLPAAGAVSLVDRCRPTHRWVRGELQRVPGGVRCHPDVALIVATSGATGDPHLVELDRSAVTAAVAGSVSAVGATADDAWLACLPPHHIGGLLVMLRARACGAPLVVHERFDVAAVAGTAGSVAFTSIVPTMAGRLLEAEVDLSRMRSILVGGGSLPEGLAARLRRQPVRWITTYGQTQSCGGVVYDGIPLPGVGVRIDRGGEIQIAGPTLLRGCRLEPAATRAALTADGWLRTGDAGRVDDAGRLRVEGRLDDLIVTGGENVWPAAVEAALGSHPGVAEVAVAGRPDREWGTRVVAFIVLAGGERPPSLAELREHGAASLPRHALPRQLEIVAALPRTALGKIRRRALPAGGTGGPSMP